MWHEEDIALNKAGLRSQIDIIDLDEYNMFSRYKTVNIKQISTNFKTGIELFKYLKKERDNNTPFKILTDIIEDKNNMKKIDNKKLIIEFSHPGKEYIPFKQKNDPNVEFNDKFRNSENENGTTFQITKENL